MNLRFIWRLPKYLIRDSDQLSRGEEMTAAPINPMGADGPCQLGIVVPCFDEEEVLPETARQLTAILNRLIAEERIKPTSRIIFVDDGSKDRTWTLIEELAHNSTFVTGIKLSRNRGHQNALLAGLFTAEGDVLVSVDADLQDDIGVIPEMLAQYDSGVDVVYGVRKDRSSDHLFKRSTAKAFYWFDERIRCGIRSATMPIFGS